MKEIIKKVLRKAGVQIKRYPDHDLARRLKIAETFKIDTLFDVGANAGQYARNMRALGFAGQIISFEPLSQAFGELKKNSQGDTRWTIQNYALGDEDTAASINVAGNSYSSSILNMMPRHEDSAPESKYFTTEKIEIKKLDTVFASFCPPHANVMLKIDTQGYEKNVLDGATESLSRISVLQLEMSLAPLYENEMLFPEMLTYVQAKGFQLFSLENGFSDSATGQLLQVDGLFVRENILG